jgi:hypothetical protein
MTMARVRRAPPRAISASTALTIGMKKQSDFPEPVPVVTTKVSPLDARAIACSWCA